ncbi:hypothetical protein OG301_29255 [Streptomyces platensis]|uniref:hypothetical protein n=1 Tax=Streptomyces platensis TaxID=58346 RepID=UPI002E1070B3|nr:hypothetical protein OG229_09440 [Streptomyces platensis]WTI55119.1 hypothetical protein OG301_29255 [Streptomyces platensis]
MTSYPPDERCPTVATPDRHTAHLHLTGDLDHTTADELLALALRQIAAQPGLRALHLNCAQVRAKVARATGQQRHTYSRLMCWVAVERMAARPRAWTTSWAEPKRHTADGMVSAAGDLRGLLERVPQDKKTD